MESNSIINQRELIEQYISSKSDLQLVDYYIDDGYSGTNFNRPGFRKLLQDMKNKKIVKSALLTKKLNGEFIGTSATYGYLKDPKDRLIELVIEELNKKFKRNTIDTLTRDVLLKNVDRVIIAQDGEVQVIMK